MKTLLEVKGLTKKYDGKKVVDNLNFKIDEGEIVGIVGGNGVGKTTTMKMITGLISRDAGEIIFKGKDAFEDFEHYIRQVGVVIEKPTFYPYLTGVENIELAGRFYGEYDDTLSVRLMKIFEMNTYMDKKVGKYSLGMKQKLGICRAFIDNPRIIILDEPTNGLDIDGAVKFRREIKRIADQQKISFLISSLWLKRPLPVAWDV